MPVYSLGTIPNQTVWVDSPRSFLVNWSNQTDATFTMTASPQPKGALTLVATNGGNWAFSFAPAPADKTPFTVHLSATANGQGDSQDFVLTPRPVLPPEATVFGTDKNTQPVAIGTYGINVVDQQTPLAESLNYESQELHNVQIVGETVTIEPGNSNGLYEAYFNGDRRDLQSMEVIAQKIIIGAPLRLKETDVTLWAQELRFESNGVIKTTPEEMTQSAGVNGGGGLPGEDGLPAGNITLNIGKLTTDNTNSREVRFDLTGGRGQPGGPGEHGVDGSSISTTWSSFRFCDSGICDTYTAPSGSAIVYWYYTIAGATVSKGGTDAWPGDGTNAKPSGKPGEGGAGGTLASSIDVAGYYTNAGGASASPTYPTSYPYDHYAGGAPGQPQVAKKVNFYYQFPLSMKDSVSSHTSKAGSDAAVAKANTVAGADGGYAVTNSPLAWVNPLALRKALDHAKDEYLGNQLDDAQSRLTNYVSILAELKASPQWLNLDATSQFELEQIDDEAKILLQRLAEGLDYYGNPAGWVPMLSFEVNTTIYQNEIDRAMNMLYLSYWIKNKAQTEQQRVDALSSARDQLRAELTQAQSNYDDAVAQIPVIHNKAITLQHDIQTVQFKLEEKETELSQKTGDPSWVTGLRLGLKLSAMMCQMIPVEQPALGAVGQGLRVASDFDPNNPWATIEAAPSIASTYLGSGFESSASDEQQAKDNVDPSQVEAKGTTYLAGLQTAATGLATGVGDIQNFLQKQKAPSPEMMAQLEKLESESPEYQELVNEVKSLMQENEQFANDLVTTMQNVAMLSNTIKRDILAIDALNRQIAPGAVVLDPRATEYLNDMEQRAYDRLIKYHYYMAKAYEYRLLQPYTQPLDLTGLLQKFEAIASLNTNTDQQITPEQFNSLKGVYEYQLSTLAESIYDQYNANRPELSVPVRFSLSDADIAALNQGGTVTLNLMNQGFFSPDEENVRIVDLSISSITTEPVGGDYGSTAYIDISIEHSGISKLKSDGKLYLFRHYNSQTQNPIVWGGRYDPVDDQIDPIQPSSASDSLLRSLLSGPATSDMLLYSRPSAWADLNISRSYFDSNGNPINIKSLRLELVYDFTPRAQNSGLRDLNVKVTTATPDAQGGLQVTNAAFLPYFQLGMADVNGRQDAQGAFLRIYQQGPGPLQLTAPAQYGLWSFNKWTDEFGNDLPGGPNTNPTITLSLQNDQTIAAQYVGIILKIGAATATTLTLHWNGGTGVHLQMATDLKAQDWTDVPGSDGQSQIQVPLTGAPEFYRAVKTP